MVLAQVPDARLVVLGEGPLRQQLEHRVKQLHLERHVVLPGFRDDVLACIKGFDLFVLSSETEGLGTSLLDAMAAGKACIGTRAGGIPEAVADGETGLIVPTHDPTALSHAIVRLLQDEPLRQRMGEAGHARAIDQFSVEKMVEGTLAAYGHIPPRS
jgi:glycosyltransferase involved in cell wall biosynthesis